METVILIGIGKSRDGDRYIRFESGDWSTRREIVMLFARYSMACLTVRLRHIQGSTSNSNSPFGTIPTTLSPQYQYLIFGVIPRR